eukprot:Em0013g1022a
MSCQEGGGGGEDDPPLVPRLDLYNNLVDPLDSLTPDSVDNSCSSLTQKFLSNKIEDCQFRKLFDTPLQSTRLVYYPFHHLMPQLGYQLLSLSMGLHLEPSEFQGQVAITEVLQRSSDNNNQIPVVQGANVGGVAGPAASTVDARRPSQGEHISGADGFTIIDSPVQAKQDFISTHYQYDHKQQ